MGRPIMPRPMKPSGDDAAAAGLLRHDPVRLHLVPAARSFLEARRTGPASALAHAELGALAWLLGPGQPPGAHVRRALETAGADSGVLLFSARVAYGSGDPALAALCWRRALQAGEANRPAVADAASAPASPAEIERRATALMSARASQSARWRWTPRPVPSESEEIRT